MANIDEIHTDLPLTLNREFFDDLIENFTIIKQAMTEQNARMDQIVKQYDDLKKQQETDTQLINDTGATTANGPRTIDISDSDPHILQ
jgi:uncharacterized protein YecA (UPF0149 family)